MKGCFGANSGRRTPVTLSAAAVVVVIRPCTVAVVVVAVVVGSGGVGVHVVIGATVDAAAT